MTDNFLLSFKPEVVAFRAGRLMLEEMSWRVLHLKSFAFETTLSGRTYVRDIIAWQDLGYQVKLIFLSLPNVEMAIARVESRVAQGGHFVPEGVVRRRFKAGLRNFKALYQPLVDDWIHYDNSGITPNLVDWGEKI